MIAPPDHKAQSQAVKRAEVEFHNFASLGEPERAHRVYAEENQRRGALLRKHLDWIGPMSPFLEIGANAGHSSYMLCNEFGARGFALDISADSLRHGRVLQETWGLAHAPVRMAGDALHLPFQDNSLKTVLAYQMLSQFMDIEAVIVEVKRVLQPGGLFIFAEEPLRRLLSLRLYRAPYWEQMKPWERKLHEWGLLGFVVQDVIGAHQEESFGIRQNHRMNLRHWNDLIRKHFTDHRYEIFVPQRGWGERITKRVAVQLDPHKSEWRAARLLGGTLAGFCRKEGEAHTSEMPADFDRLLRCPDCGQALARDAEETLQCRACSYRAPLEEGVYNLLNSADKKELYPGDRDDTIDFSLPGHEVRLGEGWHNLEGVYGNRYRWIGDRATARLKNLRGGPQQLRIRGFAPEAQGEFRLIVKVNGAPAGDWTLDRPGLFVCETELPAAAEYLIEIQATPVWQAEGDSRRLSVNLSLLRLQAP
jgi:ubiquinone/menaquinone biosynthesis C-methylase UbiE